MTRVASFEINYTRYLDPNGEVVGDLPEFARDPAGLIPFYRDMVLTRLFDAQAINLQRTGRLGTYASSEGQEASMIGIGRAMRPEDVLFPTYREHGIYLAHGVTMTEILVYWGGNESGMNFANARDDFPVSIPIATQVTHAAGAAFAFKYRKQQRAAVPVCGDGATSKGDFYEGLNAAGVWNLPCVFAVINNQWAISLPRSKQSACETMAQKAIAAGIPGEQVDGNDVVAVYDRFSKALDKARSGGGPTLIEPLTYRMRDHTTADDARRYRSDEELNQHKVLDPIKRLKTYLLAQNAWSEQQDEALMVEIQAAIEVSVKEYLDTPPRDAHTIFDCLYEILPRAYAGQADSLRAHEETNNG